MIKKCARCGKEFDAHHFNVKYCDDCRPIVKREYKREYNRKYYKQHIERHREYCRKYREEQKRKLIHEILSATGVKPK